MLNGKNIAAVLAAGTLCSAAEIAPWDKYHIPEESRWRGEALPLPDPARDIMLFGSNVEWFMADGNGLGMIDEVRRLFPDTQFVLSAVFFPPKELPEFLKQVYARGAFFQSQKAPVLDADALKTAGPHPLGDQGKEVHTENWVIATTPNYRDFYRKKLLNTAKLGVNNFKQVDFVWPWDQRYAYDDISVALFRDYLAEKDDGLTLRGDNGSLRTIKFWDYFEFYRGLRFRPADLNLRDWKEYRPVREAEVMHGAPTLYDRRNLTVFFLLYHYEHLRQYQRFGRWAGEVGAIHEATVNPESLYNACDNIFISRLNDFGTVYYEYFGSPLNSEAAYLFMPSYLRDARRSGKRIGLIKELGQGGHGRPHNTPIMEYIHNFDLVGNGFSYYQNEWEEGTFAQMKDPANAYFHNRWKVWLGGAYGYKDARNLKTFRPRAKALQVTSRSGGFYTESWIWDAQVRNTFGGDLLAAHVDVESTFPGQFPEVAEEFGTIFYTPLFTRRIDVEPLKRFLSQGGRRIITHSFIPYSIDRGVNYFAWDEQSHQIAHHAQDNLNSSDRWFLDPAFSCLKLRQGEVTGEVRMAGETLGAITIPEYWEWPVPAGEVLAEIGTLPLVTRFRTSLGNELYYVHARLSRIEPKTRRKLTALLAEAADVDRLAIPDAEHPALLHAYRLGTASGDAVVLYDRALLERDGAVLGYRPAEEWAKILFQYRADGACSGARYLVRKPGEYLVWHFISGRSEVVSADHTLELPLRLEGVFADVIYIGENTPEWRGFLDERRQHRKTVLGNLDFDPAAPMLPSAGYLLNAN